MEGCTMSSSTEHFSASVAAEEGGAGAGAASLNLSGAGYAAPPPTPLASCPPPHGFVLAPVAVPLQSTSATDNDDDDDQFLMPSTSTNTPSPPSKQDLDALAQYLLRQSLHSTPNLLPSPTLQRKRRTPTNVAAPLNFEEVVLQTFTYAGGFGEENRTGIGKACQDVGAFYILVQDAEEALSILKARLGEDDESMFEGSLITLSPLLSSTAHCHQHDILDVDSFTVDAGIDTTFRDTMTRFASLLSRISKDVLRFLLQDLPIETQANSRGHSLKPSLHIHGNGKKELNLEEDVALIIGHYDDINERERSASFVAKLGPLLQTWSQGKYKIPFSKSLCKKGGGGICVQFALTQHN